MFNRIVLHPRAAPNDRLRVWLGILMQRDRPKLTWYLDGVVTEPTPVRELNRAYSGYGPGYTGVMTGVYEFPGLQPGTIHRAQVSLGDTEYSDVLQARTLPARVGEEPFRVLLASCFAFETDRTGLAGQIVAGLRPQPDLTLLVGDQVYLDQPLFESWTGDEPTLAQRFEAKYLANWTIPAGPFGYAQILDAAPSACISDDHGFWNNYPRISATVPATVSQNVRDSWRNAASAMYTAFQQDDSTTNTQIIDVEPLSFFLMDNRRSRSENFARTMSNETLADFEKWTHNLAGTRKIPVLITGPSIFQDEKSNFDATVFDSNLANYDDFSQITSGLDMLAQAGNPVLLLTGDVHYARILQADLKLTQLTRPGGSMFEIISSPTSLVDMPFVDQWSDAWTRVRSIFNREPIPAARWRRAPLPEDGELWLIFRRTSDSEHCFPNDPEDSAR